MLRRILLALTVALITASLAQAATSPNDTTIPPTSQITDSAGNVWTLVSTYPLENGGYTAASSINLLLYHNGSIYGYTSSGSWSQWYIFASGAWVHVAGDPRAVSNLSQPIPSSLFGMQVYGVTGTTGWPTVPFGVLGKPMQSTWPYIKSSRGVYDGWSAPDGYVAGAQANGVPVMYTFEGVPGWAIAGSSTATCATIYTGALSCPQPPDNMADWTNFVNALVARYCPNGVPSIQYYELWNEPYNVYGTNYVQLSPADLATMTHAAYGIIRGNCPAANIITPNFYPVPGPSYVTSAYTSVNAYPQAYFSALGPVGTDPANIAAVHIYPANQAVDTPEDLFPGGTLNDPTTNSVFSTYVARKPVWNTEGSWGEDGIGLFASADLQAAFIARWYILHWAAGYEQMNWYAWNDRVFGTLCTQVAGGACAPIPVPVAAYDQTYNWLVGKVMYNGCSTAIDGVTWSCQLAAPGGYTGLIVWDTAGNESYTPPSPSLYTQYRNLAGNVTHYSGGAVTVGLKPILFEN